jgi:hypothetical protein
MLAAGNWRSEGALPDDEADVAVAASSVLVAAANGDGR